MGKRKSPWEVEYQPLPPAYKTIDPDDLLGDYDYIPRTGTAIAARTYYEARMQAQQAYRESRAQMDRYRYEYDQALADVKKQIEDSLIYGNGYAQTTSPQGSLSHSDMEDALRYAYRKLGVYPEERHLSGKEQCPVLIRLLRELYSDTSFGIRDVINLAVS